MSQPKDGPRPSPPPWLNKDLVQAALQRQVLSCEFSSTAVGDGYMSNMYRVVAELQGGEERCLIVKCQPVGGKDAELMKDMGLFDREIKMYTETLPAMQEILDKNGINQPISAKCLYHGTDLMQFLVLEDLRQAGFTLANRTLGLDMEHCRLVIKALANFHASSIAVLEHNPGALDFYKSSIFSEQFRNHITTFAENSLKAVEETVLKWPGFEKFSEKIQRVRQNIFDRLLETSKYKDGKFNTLIHADTWTNNMMFKYRDDAVEDIRLLDFQISYHTSPTLDLQNFFSTSLAEEVYGSVQQLLIEYHSILTSVLEKLECRTKGTTFENFEKEFEEHSVFGFVSACANLPIVMSNAAKSLNSDDLMTGEDTTRNLLKDLAGDGVYERIMKRLLMMYEELGVL